MKTWQLSILAAAAALGLQACDVNVRSADPQDGAATSQSSPAAQDTTSSTAAAPTAAATDSAALPADSSAAPTAAADAAASPTPPADPALAAGGTPLPPLASPDTGAMGAAGTPGAALSMSAGADGSAAPTELARFLEENPVAPRKGDTASSQPADGKSSAAKADAAQGGKS